MPPPPPTPAVFTISQPPQKPRLGSDTIGCTAVHSTTAAERQPHRTHAALSPSQSVFKVICPLLCETARKEQRAPFPIFGTMVIATQVPCETSIPFKSTPATAPFWRSLRQRATRSTIRRHPFPCPGPILHMKVLTQCSILKHHVAAAESSHHGNRHPFSLIRFTV